MTISTQGPAPLGRNTALTEELIERLANEVRQGLTYEVAAARAGINVRTLHMWRNRAEMAEALQAGDVEPGPCPNCGAAGDDHCITRTGNRAAIPHAARPSTSSVPATVDLHVRLFHELKKAEADAHATNLAAIQVAARGNVKKGIAPQWQAAAWFLERRYKHLYARPAVVAGGFNADGSSQPIRTQEEIVESIRAKLAAIAEAEGDADDA